MTREEHNRRRGRSSKWIWRPTRLAIYRRDGFACVWCGSRERLTLDHAIPRSRGGNGSPSNLLTACKRCNDSRQDRPLRAFAVALGGDFRATLNRVNAARKRRLPRPSR